ncbi:MAG: arylsulfatase [Bacteroidales bacterium]|nr:arylsulfatase [Bacteroidales bacterium]
MNKNRLTLIILLFYAISTIFTACSDINRSGPMPNIILIYFDDLGYGDLSVYGASEISTPNIDRLTQGGIMFTDAHSSSATCTPSRYALLTGEYPWRNERARVLSGTAPLLIDTAQLTLPRILREKGYYTGIVGKWHLGLGSGNVDWNRHISPGPNEVGFDYSFILAATQDRVPTVYIENGNVVQLDPGDPIEVSYQENFPGEPTGLESPEMLKMMWDHGHNNSIVNGIPRIGFMKGGKAARWVDENMADTFLVKARNYIKDHRDEPFFLYYALQQPHVPRTPHERFVGETTMGPRGDVIVEADWCIGQLMNTLEEERLLENTFIILSSDNGPVLNDGYIDYAVEKVGDHTPSGPFRGGKYSLFEAGTRVPFVTYWNGRIEPGISDVLVSQIDIMSSLASLAGNDRRGPDSHDMMNLFLGSDTAGRKELILEAGGRTALRKGNWVLIPPYPGPAIARNVDIELGNSYNYQLYNLTEDPGQQNNLADTRPEELKEMLVEYQSIINVRLE